jgi:hypothetical protein
MHSAAYGLVLTYVQSQKIAPHTVIQLGAVQHKLPFDFRGNLGRSPQSLQGLVT